MKKLFFIITLFVISISINAQISNALSAHLGDSWANGILGIEYQISNYAISTGWITGKFPGDKDINSFSIAATMYQQKWNESGFYLSTAYTTNGYSYIEKTDLKTNYYSEPSIIVLLGYKSTIEKNSYFKVGIGIDSGEHGRRFEFEVLLGLNLFKNKINE